LPNIAEMTRAIAQLKEVRSLIGSCMLKEMRTRLEGTQEGSIQQGDVLGLFNDTFVGETRSSLRIALDVLEERLDFYVVSAEYEQNLVKRIGTIDDYIDAKWAYRRCEVCHVFLSEGYVIEGGEEYFCNDHEPPYFKELYDADPEDGDTYWTQWDD